MLYAVIEGIIEVLVCCKDGIKDWMQRCKCHCQSNCFDHCFDISVDIIERSKSFRN